MEIIQGKQNSYGMSVDERDGLLYVYSSGRTRLLATFHPTGNAGGGLPAATALAYAGRPDRSLEVSVVALASLRMSSKHQASLATNGRVSR